LGADNALTFLFICPSFFFLFHERTTMTYLATSTSLALLLVALDSIPAIQSIARIARKSRDHEPIQLAKDVYCDEDGEATEESLRAFSDKWQRIAIALCSIVGFLATLAMAVLATLNLAIPNPSPIWLQFTLWVSRKPENKCGTVPFEASSIADCYFLVSARYSSCCFLHRAATDKPICSRLLRFLGEYHCGCGSGN
jgi:hypothetical protein